MNDRAVNQNRCSVAGQKESGSAGCDADSSSCAAGSVAEAGAGGSRQGARGPHWCGAGSCLFAAVPHQRRNIPSKETLVFFYHLLGFISSTAELLCALFYQFLTPPSLS